MSVLCGFILTAYLAVGILMGIKVCRHECGVIRGGNEKRREQSYRYGSKRSTGRS
jgi:hypothetical protein